MSNGATYFKYATILVLAVLAYLLFRGCGRNEGSGEYTQDTIRVTVTKTVEVIKTDTQYVPKIRKVTVTDTDTQFVYVPKMVRQPGISSTVYYSDTIPNKYGSFVVNDTISGNIITGRGVETNISVPTITKTVTLESKKKAIGYFGIGLAGNQGTPLFGTSASLALKAKNDKIYSIGAILTKGEQIYYTFNVYIPIRLTKK
jgi:hypothetical protein